MSVLNTFVADIVKVSDDPKEVYLDDGFKKIFDYDIKCSAMPRALRYYFFFNLKSQMLLTIHKSTRGYQCELLKFCLRDDLPVPSSNCLLNHPSLMKLIANDFKEQYATHLLDQTINS